MQIDEQEYPHRRSGGASDAPEENLSQHLIEAAQALLESALEDHRKRTDGADSTIDLDSIGVHFSPLDCVVMPALEGWLIVITDDMTRTVIASTCVFERRTDAGGCDVER